MLHLTLFYGLVYPRLTLVNVYAPPAHRNKLFNVITECRVRPGCGPVVAPLNFGVLE